MSVSTGMVVASDSTVAIVSWAWLNGRVTALHARVTKTKVLINTIKRI